MPIKNEAEIFNLILEKFEILDEYTLTTNGRRSDRIKTLDGESRVTKEAGSYLIYDCSKPKFDFDYKIYSQHEGKKSVYTVPVMIFKNWIDERQKFNKAYEALPDAKSRRELIGFFERKTAIYVDLPNKLKLNVNENGINYLEYKIKDTKEEILSGFIYNMSLAELKRIYNVTGTDLFKKNVRSGIENNATGKQLKKDFKDYIRVFMYSELSANLEKLDSEFKDDCLEELKGQFDIDEETIKRRRPDKFWFYHNGVTLFSYDSENKINRSGSTIEINPKKVSVINGAQTLTNFYTGLEEIELQLDSTTLITGTVEFQGIVQDILSESLKKVEGEIHLKTIFISGTEENVWPITFGLNTQIPILERDIIANSNVVNKINEILLKNQMKILREGESVNVGVGLNVRDFAKYHLIIQNEPGKSKNLNKNQIEETIDSSFSEMESKTDEYLKKLDKLLYIEEWWINYREKNGDKKYIELETYGKNYFQSFVLINLQDDINKENLDFLYEEFLQRFYNLKPELSVGDFKTDIVFKKYYKSIERNSNKINIDEKFKLNEEELKKYITDNKNNNYSVRNTIFKYLKTKNIEITNLRVISIVNNKVKESFPFSRETFSELYFGIDYSNPKYKDYNESKFKKEVNKSFPVLIIYWKEKDQHNIKDIKFISNFSFRDYDNSAEKIYKLTVDAFIKGDELDFPKISANQDFHVRPKGINKNDSFEFSDGSLITKRTFWANAGTIEEILKKSLND